VACGFSGTASSWAGVGACMGEMILDGQARTVDVSAFTARRFEKGELLKGEHDYKICGDEARR